MSIFKIIIFAVIAAILIGGGIWYNHFLDKKSQEQAAAQAAADKAAAQKAVSDILSRLQIKDVKLGTGSEAKNGDTITVNYVGTLDDGTVFDSNTDQKFKHVQPFSFTLGAGNVIQGWDLGLLGMKVGGKRQLVIPPELGYGGNSVGPIPPNSTLHFTVELLGIKSK